MAAVVASVAVVAWAEDGGAARLKEILSNPPATGVIVTWVAPKSAASAAGLRVADIIVSYAGKPTPSLRHLVAAKEGAAGGAKVRVHVARGAEQLDLEIAAGQIGVAGFAVQKGVAVPERPPAPDIALDLSGLRAKPIETWCVFSLDGGKSQSGFEHHILRVQGERLVLDSEVAFDGGERWGRNHFLAHVVSTAQARPPLLEFQFSCVGADV